ncbi:DUF2877 domain-containing protein [Isachenkonia alkalipeptolytica]|uniref:DUF2877 domain-containing protein n=1 Tax=Isachenkonia alkalipeptolytica TaxID=2565777 RepID=A0AA43XMG4_9CLOT|nr:DUF2877 domain-containing protein [Isachenkonia alkalipeptolytica]NBG89257.1 DUF2877 domain-containing protein [Isachenkonia alkalipeptolytica]
MKIKLMDKKLYEELTKEKEESFQVHSVFKEACNLYTPRGLWVTLVTENRYLPPNGIKLNHSRDLRECYRQGELIGFSFRDQKVERLNLSLHSQAFDQGESKKNKSLKLEFMKAYLDLKGEAEALGNRNLPEGVRASLQSLEKALAENHSEKIKKAAKGLIGFGHGLTPSMDDYLTGRILMWKTWRMQSPAVKEADYSLAIKEVSKGRTTTASEWLIHFAAEGRCSEEIMNFLHSYFSKSSGGDFEHAFKEVLRIGSTSGEDLMYGMWSEGERLFKKYEGGSSEWE